MHHLNAGQFADKRVLVRVDFNVPLNKDLQISDDRRMRAALPTLKHLLEQGASLVILSHLGRPKAEAEGSFPAKFSLRNVQDHLARLLGRPVFFVSHTNAQALQEIAQHLDAGDVVLLENVRYTPAETSKNEAERQAFAQHLAQLGDAFVNDAFGSAHRAHASVFDLAKLFDARYAGFLLASELENAQRVLSNPESPYVAIMGGAKVSDKLLIMRNLLNRVSSILVGGGMSYTFLKAQGYEIGNSLCEEELVETARQLLDEAKQKGVDVVLPVDSIVADRFDAQANTQTVDNTAIPQGWMGLDIGPKSIELFREKILGARTLLWNGPMGVFELSAFAQGTLQVAKQVAEATEAGAYSLVGGGDSAAALEQTGLSDRISYVSTGGGALLEYLEGKTLPGVAALD